MLPAGTLTFVFTDVEGSTRLLRELGAEGYAAALAEHRAAIRRRPARPGEPLAGLPEAAWAEGRALSLEGAVAYALGGEA